MTGSTAPSEQFLTQSTLFVQELVNWERNLPSLAWSDFTAASQQGKVALFSVDMINGFCHKGLLASPRVEGIIPEVVAAFKNAHALGVRDFVLAQDCHTPDAAEFAAFPPHCQIGTEEAATIPELAELLFSNLYTIVEKNSLSPFHATHLGQWVEEHRDLSAAIVVGNCTDLCVYQMAMYLRLHANAHDLNMRVIVPENAVQTYDIPIETAKQIGSLPHDGDFLHLTFLYHMRLNGIEVVRSIKG